MERVGGRAWIEPRFQLPGPDDQHTDVRVALGHRVIYVDVSVVHPTAVSYRLTASRRTLSTAARAEGTKARQYAERAAAEHADFVPFIIESYGGFGEQARRFANEIAAHARIGSDLWSTRCPCPTPAGSARRLVDEEPPNDDETFATPTIRLLEDNQELPGSQHGHQLSTALSE